MDQNPIVVKSRSVISKLYLSSRFRGDECNSKCITKRLTNEDFNNLKRTCEKKKEIIPTRNRTLTATDDTERGADETFDAIVQKMADCWKRLPRRRRCREEERPRKRVTARQQAAAPLAAAAAFWSPETTASGGGGGGRSRNEAGGGARGVGSKLYLSSRFRGDECNSKCITKRLTNEDFNNLKRTCEKKKEIIPTRNRTLTATDDTERGADETFDAIVQKMADCWKRLPVCSRQKVNDSQKTCEKKKEIIPTRNRTLTATDDTERGADETFDAIVQKMADCWKRLPVCSRQKVNDSQKLFFSPIIPQVPIDSYLIYQ
ncbi:hypothetical protein LXL04_007370 [Taraxacum kok-saghyz]